MVWKSECLRQSLLYKNQRVWTPLWIDQSQGGGITDPVQEIIKITGAATTIEAAIAQSDHGRFWISF